MTNPAAKARAALEGITPGNWHAADCISPRIVLYATPCNAEKVRDSDVLYLGHVYADGAGQGRRNLRFIAAAPTLVRELCEEVDKLRALLGEAVYIAERAGALTETDKADLDDCRKAGGL
jgi:hypothetical protein